MRTPEELREYQQVPDYIPADSTTEDITNLVNISFGRIAWSFETPPRSYKECGHGVPCFYASVKDRNLINKPYAIMGFFSYMRDFSGKAIRINYFYDN